jgi:hypothetical protein
MASIVRGFIVLLLVFSPLARAQTATAVEYYHADWNYYFVTSFPEEIAFLDAGAFGGVWQRTGQTFSVWTGATGDALATCRFFSTNFAPKSSHFYTPFASECTSLQANPNWQYESIAFYLQLPSAAGVCPADTVVLYRLYNNGMGGAPNHRYTTSAAAFNQMRAAGWVFEGDATTGAFACVPSQGPTVQTAEGLYFGTTSLNQTWAAIVLDDATFYVIYSIPGTSAVGGFVYGDSTAANGLFTSSNARDFGIASDVYSTLISGSYIPRTSISGVATEQGLSTAFTAHYDPSYEQPATLAAIEGNYSGSAASSAGWQPLAVSISSTGALAGSGQGCNFSGTATPRGNVNVYNISVNVLGGVCIFGTSTFTGIAYFDPTTRTIYAAAPNASRTDGFLFMGSR